MVRTSACVILNKITTICLSSVSQHLYFALNVGPNNRLQRNRRIRWIIFFLFTSNPRVNVEVGVSLFFTFVLSCVGYWLCMKAYARLWAMSTFSPVGSRSSNGVRICVCVWTEWTWSMHYAGISAHQFTPYYATQATHAHPQTIWGQRTDGAKSGYCRIIW